VLGLLAFGAWKLHEAEQRRLEDLRASEERRLKAQRQTERLQKLERARRAVKEFRRLADEARFYAATTDPVAEHSPYFDPRQGETRMKAALALAGSWGPGLKRLPLERDVNSLKKEVYDLYLLLAQTQGRPGAGAKSARAVLGLLEKASALRPPSRSFYRFRAQAYALLGERQKAARDRRRAKDPKTPATSLDHFLLGEQYRRESAGKAGGPAEQKSWQPDARRIEKAVAEYRRALAIDPDHYWSHFQLGRCFLAQDRLPEAEAAFGACIALRPEAAWGYSVRGFALAQQKRYPEAERDLDRAVALNPDARVPRLNRGVVYWQQKKNTQALADFAAVLAAPKQKRLVEAAYYRGQLYLQLGRVKAALEDFDRVVAENPRFRPVYPVRARIYIARGNSARGLADLDAYLADGQAYDRRSWQACARRGRLLRLLYADLPPEQRRQPSARALAVLAVAELQKAVKKGGRAAQVFDDLGAMLELSGSVDQAVAAYNEGVKRAPKDVKLLNKRGWAYDQIGQRNKALADFTTAARLEPENAEAHSGLGYIRALQKLPPEAQREADLALLHGSDNYLILHNVACIYTVLAQADKPRATAFQDVAMALLRRAVQLWKKAPAGPNEVQLIKGDPTFKPLGDRPDFQELVEDRQ
jgi:tetratricopeptide (TPR) repeat protein